MIRINLLPEAKRVAVASGSTQLWGIIYLLTVFAWGVVLFLLFLSGKGKLDDQLAANQALDQLIQEAKAKSANIGEVEAALAKSRQLEEVVGKLQSARQGPARLLMEISQLLSEGGGPTVSKERLDQIRSENPLATFSPGWDFRRLWLTGFTENDRHCKVTGFGKTNEDVAEFLRRLALSEIFQNVTLTSTSAAAGAVKDGGGAVVAFTLACEVRY